MCDVSVVDWVMHTMLMVCKNRRQVYEQNKVNKISCKSKTQSVLLGGCLSSTSTEVTMPNPHDHTNINLILANYNHLPKTTPVGFTPSNHKSTNALVARASQLQSVCGSVSYFSLFLLSPLRPRPPIPIPTNHTTR